MVTQHPAGGVAVPCRVDCGVDSGSGRDEGGVTSGQTSLPTWEGGRPCLFAFVPDGSGELGTRPGVGDFTATLGSGILVCLEFDLLFVFVWEARRAMSLRHHIILRLLPFAHMACHIISYHITERVGGTNRYV
jgi:hypothetical protein